MPLLPIISAAPTDEVSISRIVVWSLVMIGVIIVGWLIVAQVKRRLQGPDDDATGTGGIGFTLSDLRQMHKSGQISDEEFERAKGKIVEAARRSAERMGVPGGGNGDVAISGRRRRREPDEPPEQA